LFFIFSLKVIEGMLVQHTKFLILAAFDQLFSILPGDWAVVLELRNRSLQ
jgi:hypothetical protein